MIKFFRKIRQNMIKENKVSKYILYAIGEIILVVIGILIALSINNSNQNRLLQRQETKLLSTLLKDLYLAKSKSTMLINKEENALKSFEFFLSGKSARETLINNPKIDSLFHRLIWSNVNTDVPIINAYTDLKNSGKTGLISNENIRIHFTGLENGFNRLDKILHDRLSVQLINIDGFIINEMNFVQLLKENKNKFKVDYGLKNDY